MFFDKNIFLLALLSIPLPYTHAVVLECPGMADLNAHYFKPRNQILNQMFLIFVWFFGSLVRFMLCVPANQTKGPKNQKYPKNTQIGQ